ncbi:low molecular weight protein tyrosine phosphatase family protein [Pseudoalteromonas sp. SG43-3]|uniref:low molecular weight protein tyrosine phosphatase family protein n=1 Tax=Pseudoalteromonas sp. SG43-3 TaxID=2760970 RepID=UPI0021759C7D|nr:phosphotyrosine protein phosphatase [Pseudoalteromonas sp. SG43-3]
MMTKVLFVCSQNKLRSPTAEAIFSGEPNLEVRSAGLNNNAEIPLGAEDVQWAEIIFVMEQAQKSKLKKKYKDILDKQRVICLGIPDNYDYMDPKLIKIFENNVPQFLP